MIIRFHFEVDWFLKLKIDIKCTWQTNSFAWKRASKRSDLLLSMLTTSGFNSSTKFRHCSLSHPLAVSKDSSVQVIRFSFRIWHNGSKYSLFSERGSRVLGKGSQTDQQGESCPIESHRSIPPRCPSYGRRKRDRKTTAPSYISLCNARRRGYRYAGLFESIPSFPGMSAARGNNSCLLAGIFYRG